MEALILIVIVVGISYAIFTHTKTTYSKKAYYAGRKDGMRVASGRRNARRRTGRGGR